MTGLKPFAIAVFIALVSGSATYAADHREAPMIREDITADIADIYTFSGSLQDSFTGIESDLDADLTYSDETTDTEPSLVRK